MELRSLEYRDKLIETLDKAMNAYHQEAKRFCRKGDTQSDLLTPVGRPSKLVHN